MTRAGRISVMTRRVLRSLDHSQYATLAAHPPQCISSSGNSMNGTHRNLQTYASSSLQIGNSVWRSSAMDMNTNTTIRGLAIRKRSKRRADDQNGAKDGLPLMNEHLIKQIMAQSNGSSPKDVQLRLVVEKDSQTPPESQVTSLASAIETSLDHGLDLVAIDLKHELPVVRAVQYEAKLYRASKQKNKTKNKPLELKEFRFKARTADHDLQRKIVMVREFLQKGHKCRIQATCPKRVVLSTNPQGAVEVMERVLEEIGDAGEAANAVEGNLEKTFAAVTIVPTNTSSN